MRRTVKTMGLLAGILAFAVSAAAQLPSVRIELHSDCGRGACDGFTYMGKVGEPFSVKPIVHLDQYEVGAAAMSLDYDSTHLMFLEATTGNQLLQVYNPGGTLFDWDWIGRYPGTDMTVRTLYFGDGINGVAPVWYVGRLKFVPLRPGRSHVAVNTYYESTGAFTEVALIPILQSSTFANTLSSAYVVTVTSTGAPVSTRRGTVAHKINGPLLSPLDLLTEVPAVPASWAVIKSLYR